MFRRFIVFVLASLYVRIKIVTVLMLEIIARIKEQFFGIRMRQNYRLFVEIRSVVSWYVILNCKARFVVSEQAVIIGSLHLTI